MKKIFYNTLFSILIIMFFYSLSYPSDIQRLYPQLSDNESKRHSLNNYGKIVVSNTGNWYYMGMKCSDDCSGHIAGYEWAIDNNIREEAICENEKFSKSFAEGCLEGSYAVSNFDGGMTSED